MPFARPTRRRKWAIVGLMKSLAIELGPHGIRVNAILPGLAGDVAGLALFLCSSAARNLTGQAISVCANLGRQDERSCQLH